MAEAVITEIPAEVDDSPEARAEDIKKLWQGFEEFKKSNPEIVERSRKEVGNWAKQKYGEEREYLVDRGSEAMLLFYYGAQMARNLQPELTKGIEIPGIEHMESMDFTLMSKYFSNTGLLSETGFVKDYRDLIIPENKYTNHVEPWRRDLTKSTQSFFSDWVVVDLVLAGTEEYAHNLFAHYKQGPNLLKFFKETGEMEKKVGDMQRSGVEYIDQDVTYHASTVERHGLVWQQRVLEKHLPHWVKPTREFVDRVRRERLEKFTSRKTK